MRLETGVARLEHQAVHGSNHIIHSGEEYLKIAAPHGANGVAEGVVARVGRHGIAVEMLVGEGGQDTAEEDARIERIGCIPA